MLGFLLSAMVILPILILIVLSAYLSIKAAYKGIPYSRLAKLIFLIQFVTMTAFNLYKCDLPEESLALVHFELIGSIASIPLILLSGIPYLMKKYESEEDGKKSILYILLPIIYTVGIIAVVVIYFSYWTFESIFA